MKKSILLNALSKYIIIFFFAQGAFCQIPINVIASNKLDQIKIHDTIFQKFSGNVIIDYSDLRIICDTILIDEYKTSIKGWGNTQIFNDTLNCKSDSINIKKNENQILFYDNIVLKTDDMIINTDAMEYDYEKEKK